MGYRLKPGRQLAGVISAMSGGMAEDFLRAMTFPKGCEVMRRGHMPRHPFREATPWKQDGNCEFSVVTVTFAPEEKRTVTLKLGVCEEIFLKDAGEGAKKFSLKLTSGVDGELVIPVPPRIQSKRVPELACHTLMMVVRGTEWTDRSGSVHKSPCGDHLSAKKSLTATAS